MAKNLTELILPQGVVNADMSNDECGIA